jgi:hypothetical protein
VQAPAPAPPPSSAPVDLDISAFRVTKEVEHGGAVQVRLVVKNNGKFDQPRPATVVGMQNGAEGFRQILKVSAPVSQNGYAEPACPVDRPSAPC